MIEGVLKIMADSGIEKNNTLPLRYLKPDALGECCLPAFKCGYVSKPDGITWSRHHTYIAKLPECLLGGRRRSTRSARECTRWQDVKLPMFCPEALRIHGPHRKIIVSGLEVCLNRCRRLEYKFCPPSIVIYYT